MKIPEPTIRTALEQWFAIGSARPDAETARNWYPIARRAINAIAAAHGIPEHQAVLAAAALSPRERWSRNLTLLAIHCAGGSGGTLGRNSTRATALLAGAPQRTLSGPKVRAFAACLLGSTTAVCIDTWILRAAGLPLNLTPKRAEIIARIIRDIAAREGILPSAVQAVIWVGIRGETF